MNNLLWFLGKLFIPGDTVPKPHYLQVLIGSAEATVKQTSKTRKCTLEIDFFFQLFFLFGWFLFGFV